MKILNLKFKINHIYYSRHKNQMFVCQFSSQINIVDISTFEIVETIHHSHIILKISPILDDNYLLYGDIDGRIYQYCFETKKSELLFTRI